MSHRLILISILVLALGATGAVAGSAYHDWSLSVGTNSIERIDDMDTDSYGNIYALGYFLDTVDFGAGPLTSAGSWDIYLVKFAPDGTVLWNQSFGTAQMDIGKSLDVDPFGFVALVGNSQGTIDFGGGPLANAGGYDVVVARFSPSGTHLWSTSFGGTGHDYGTGIAHQSGGDVVISGHFEASINLGPGYTSLGSSDVFLARFDDGGGLIWSQAFGSIETDYGAEIAIDADDNVIFTTWGYGALDLGGGMLPLLGNLDMFLAKLDASGAHIWSKTVGGNSADHPKDVGIDAAGDITLTAYCVNQPDFGGGPILSNGGYDTYLARFDPAGNHVWSNGFGGTGYDQVQRAAVGASGEITITGNFENTADFGGTPLVAAHEEDIFVAHYATDGTHEWSRGFGGPNDDVGGAVTVDAYGNVSLGAEFATVIDVGGGVIVGQGNDDVLIARFLQGPDIHSVLDVPGDQGGRVNVSWDACSADNTTDQTIREYTVWQAIDAGAATAMIAEGAVLIDDPSGMKGAGADASVVRTASAPHSGSVTSSAITDAPYYWSKVATAEALGLAHYAAPAPTLYDSTSASPENHYFQVIAHTADAFVYYTSEPDSGYSLDNLAPGAPQNLAAVQKATPAGLELKWDANSEADLSHYEIFRGTDPGFPADGGSYLTATADTSSLDTGWQWDGGYHYKVFAVDTHGNRSPYTLIGPSLVVSVGKTPAAATLEQNIPNPFNPTTTIGFTLDEAADVALRIYDASGRLVRTLADGHRGASHHTVSWDGRDNAGNTVASGVYFYRLTAGAFADTKKMVLIK